jgi:predicted ArsR family transcriptional regulator
MRFAAYLERKMKTQMHPSRELVLKAIRKHPEATVNKIAYVTGLSGTAVRKHAARLMLDELIHEVKLDSKSGARNLPANGYRFGKDLDAEAARERAKRAPKQWDVLAYFFGRIAAEPAAA